MNIYEALQAAEKTSGVIYRPSTETCRLFAGQYKYSIVADCNGICAQKEFGDGWAPTVEDLMATDWKVLQELTGA